ncbi:aldo/keto reductase [Actinomadura atramentaria]|uniref:aldo/keto reductase n=1 Tax=Actinomadura atramentaria TaxID=1990 RepID=UPI00035DEF1F|nr:aldo/keto reductase [Actinomadura atramentaria]
MNLGVDAIDTSFSYHDFASHRTLARKAGDLLREFTVSTKIGFFPARHGAEHSLDPMRLRTALEQTNRDLGRTPDLVFLHNPERSLRPRHIQQAREVLGQACAALDEAAADGLCGAWGIASWNPEGLPALIDGSMPRPHALMVRSGLFVGIETLDASAALAARWDAPGTACWGMSPFAGDASNAAREGLDPRLFLRGAAADCSRAAAAFRVACRLPSVSSLAVGADDPRHLGALLDSLRFAVDDRRIRRYVELLRSHRVPVSRAGVP